MFDAVIFKPLAIVDANEADVAVEANDELTAFCACEA